MLITVIGRGHSGTRAMSHTLSEAGVFMGSPLNPSGDLLPPDPMYDACRVMAQYVRWTGGLQWDFEALHTMPIPAEFTDLIQTYLHSVMTHESEYRGWKIPETTLVYPWIRRLFPDMAVIFWIRNPRDCILGRHVTDDLSDFNIPYPPTNNPREQRAISWFYQYELVQSTPPPAKTIEIRFEDFVRRQDETVRRLETFLGIPLPRIPVKPEAVDRWKLDTEQNYFPFLEKAMRKFGYEIPVLNKGD